MSEGGGKGRGRGGQGVGGDDGSNAPPKACQDGNWMCPNTSCMNVNFAFRGVCNRCGSARPYGSSGGGAGVAGRGRARGGPHSGGGHTVLFGPNDWPCPMCGNINWAKHLKCIICNNKHLVLVKAV